MKLLGYAEEANPLLGRRTVHLEVLMTPNCYSRTHDTGRYRIAWLNNLINEGLRGLQRDHGEIRFDFKFTEFPALFEWTDDDHQALLSLRPVARRGKDWEHVRAKPAWETLRLKMNSAVEDRLPAALR